MGEEVEGAPEEVVDIADGGFGFGGNFYEADEVGGGEDAGIFGPDAVAVIDHGDIAKGVEIAFSAPCEIELRRVEEIELAGERTFRPACAFGHGFEKPEF